MLAIGFRAELNIICSNCFFIFKAIGASSTVHFWKLEKGPANHLFYRSLILQSKLFFVVVREIFNRKFKKQGTIINDHLFLKQREQKRRRSEQSLLLFVKKKSEAFVVMSSNLFIFNFVVWVFLTFASFNIFTIPLWPQLDANIKAVHPYPFIIFFISNLCEMEQYARSEWGLFVGKCYAVIQQWRVLSLYFNHSKTPSGL